jgi:hypothetical protein
LQLSQEKERDIYKVLILKSKRDGKRREEIEWATARMLGLLLHRPRNCSWRLEKFVGGG